MHFSSTPTKMKSSAKKNCKSSSKTSSSIIRALVAPAGPVAPVLSVLAVLGVVQAAGPETMVPAHVGRLAMKLRGVDDRTMAARLSGRVDLTNRAEQSFTNFS
jgi:hypothetical protein